MIPIFADDAAIAQAADLLRQGQLVAFPTETVYGLGADAGNPEAVGRIFAAKGRPADHPLIVHLADAGQLSDWAAVVPEAALRLAAKFWPGPMALVLPKQDWVPTAVTGGQATVALRVPNHPVALKLLRAFGGGTAAPSANRFCRISPTLAGHVAEELGDAVAMILDGGPCQVGVESTIIDLSGGHPRLLRPGQITDEALAAVLGTKPLLPQALQPEVRAPGMLALHYAPVTETLLCAGDDLPDRVAALLAADKRVGVLAYSRMDSQGLPDDGRVRAVAMPESAEAYAQALYASLRQLDSLGLDLILVEQPPQGSVWQAVNDRLSKAAGSRQ
jgi:L-threonylcarbamoyladenylate synthase